jgi:hypothetical protein
MSPVPEICDLPVWSPLYLLRSTHPCPRCGRAADVVALVAERYDDCLEDSDEAEQSLGPRGWLHSVLLTPVIRLPPVLAEAVHALAPGYTPAPTRDGARGYANHCPCGHVLPDADVYGLDGPFDMEATKQPRGVVEVVVVPFAEVQRVTCDFVEADGVEAVLEDWWRRTAEELLARLRDSTKPGARGYAVAVARALACLMESGRELDCLGQGVDPFAEDEHPNLGPEGLAPLELWADMQVWAPLFLMTSAYRCWRCGEDSPVAAILAERHFEVMGRDRPARENPPAHAQHVVMLCNIERMSPDLERALAEAAPMIRLDRSRTAGTTYYMNHCRACGTRFGDFFLSETDGPFWVWSPGELEQKGITLELLPVEGMQALCCGTAACNIYVWAHERWWRMSLQRLVEKLAKRGDPQAHAYAAALDRALGELACLERNIDFARMRATRVAPDERQG